jgi:hypothetical protein
MGKAKSVSVGNACVWLTAGGAGKVLGVSGAAVTASARKGAIPFIFDGGRRLRLYRLTDIEDFRDRRDKARAKAGIKA